MERSNNNSALQHWSPHRGSAGYAYYDVENIRLAGFLSTAPPESDCAGRTEHARPEQEERRMAAKRSGERLVAVTSEEIGPDNSDRLRIYLDRRRIARRANDGTWIMLEPELRAERKCRLTSYYRAEGRRKKLIPPARQHNSADEPRNRRHEQTEERRMAAKRSGERLVAVTSEEICPDDWIDLYLLGSPPHRATCKRWNLDHARAGLRAERKCRPSTIERKADERR